MKAREKDENFPSYPSAIALPEISRELSQRNVYSQKRVIMTIRQLKEKQGKSKCVTFQCIYC
jgi:hypothetical protein